MLVLVREQCTTAMCNVSLLSLQEINWVLFWLPKRHGCILLYFWPHLRCYRQPEALYVIGRNLHIKSPIDGAREVRMCMRSAQCWGCTSLHSLAQSSVDRPANIFMPSGFGRNSLRIFDCLHLLMVTTATCPEFREHRRQAAYNNVHDNHNLTLVGFRQ